MEPFPSSDDSHTPLYLHFERSPSREESAPTTSGLASPPPQSMEGRLSHGSEESGSNSSLSTVFFTKTGSQSSRSSSAPRSPAHEEDDAGVVSPLPPDIKRTPDSPPEVTSDIIQSKANPDSVQVPTLRIESKILEPNAIELTQRECLDEGPPAAAALAQQQPVFPQQSPYKTVCGDCGDCCNDCLICCSDCLICCRTYCSLSMARYIFTICCCHFSLCQYLGSYLCCKFASRTPDEEELRESSISTKQALSPTHTSKSRTLSEELRPASSNPQVSENGHED